MIACLCLWAGPAWACELGEVCWEDRSGGTATTELRFRAEGGEVSTLVEPGLTSFRFVELLRSSPLLPSEWLCVQGRQRTTAGVSSDWYLSEREGVCDDPAAVVPPLVEPTPPSPEEIFSALSNRNGRLSVDYQLADCPRGVQQTTSAIRNGRRTITLTCRR